jgi:hypothetical protein
MVGCKWSHRPPILRRINNGYIYHLFTDRDYHGS